MVWDRSKLAIEVVEVFAEATVWATHDAQMFQEHLITQRRTADAARSSDYYHFTVKIDQKKLDAYRARKRDEKRMRRRGKIGRPSTRYVQLDLPFMEEMIMREKLPVDRNGITQKFTIITRKDDGSDEIKVEEVDIYLTANVYPLDYKNEARRGKLGEIFLRIGKAGHTEAVYGEWAKNASHALQSGISVDELFRKHVGTRFDPHGATTHPIFKRCTSPLDLVSRWILARYGSDEAKKWIASMNGQPQTEEGVL